MQDFNQSMLEVFIFETGQFIEQLETAMLSCEKSQWFTESSINEIFRVMHTIKSSAAMMMYDNISQLAHTVEDLFYCLREDKPDQIDFSGLSDLVFESIDFMKVEMEKIKNGDNPDGNVTDLISRTAIFLKTLKSDGTEAVATPEISVQQFYIAPARKGSSAVSNFFKAVVFFQDGCQMEDVRAFGLVHKLKDVTDKLFYLPSDIVENDDTAEIIQKEGFTIYLGTELSYDKVRDFFMQTVFLKELELVELEDDREIKAIFAQKAVKESKSTEIRIPDVGLDVEQQTETKVSAGVSTSQQSFISVSVARLDALMDLVGEMVIAEAMVVQNPDLQGLELNNFYKAAEQLNKITDEIQRIVMSVRMVSLSSTFYRMQRVVRDMCKKLDKDISLLISGENTEVDKNIIEHLADPLMHLVRNAVDHGIETKEERLASGKPASGIVTLEAKNLGSDVLINVKDDGKGLNKEQVLEKAIARGLLAKPAENMSETEIYNLILLPGFSTKENVSQFSGRGVGMNVVTENIEAIGGAVSVNSVLGEGSTISLKIPLTLAIIDGMNLKVGNSRYTLPTISIRESFRPLEKDIIIDPDGNEMILVRGEALSIIRLHELFSVNTAIKNFWDGILITIEQDSRSVCVFADELLGQQQVVVKSLPDYMRNYKKSQALAGCTLLGDGSISLILEPNGLVNL